MENFIDHINISNFKSIRELKLEGLSRINLFIGKPNVGKSNILEALGVFSLPFLELNSNKKLSSFIRIENQNEIFFDGIFENQIILKTNVGKCIITKNPDYKNPETGEIEKATFNFLQVVLNNLESESSMFFDSKPGLNLTGVSGFKKSPKEKRTDRFINIKYYNFSEAKFKKQDLNYLVPPNGSNLFHIIENISSLKNEVIDLFKEYNLNLLFDRANEKLRITKPPKNGEIFSIPYNSVADTLQRIIFYKTAIVSNQNSVLIFEEPEAHAFPPYIVHITQEIIDAQTNQFLLSTHSPYVLDYFLENAFDETSIFMVDYKNGETVTNKLSKEDMSDILRYGIDLFTNYETFLK